MSYSFYQFLHVSGIVTLIFTLGAVTLHAMNGGEKKFPHRKWVFMFHGFGLLAILIAGFGLMARIGLQFPWPGWVWVKLTVWFVLGGSTALPFKKPELAKFVWVGILMLAYLNIYMAEFKPF